MPVTSFCVITVSLLLRRNEQQHEHHDRDNDEKPHENTNGPYRRSGNEVDSDRSHRNDAQNDHETIVNLLSVQGISSSRCTTSKDAGARGHQPV